MKTLLILLKRLVLDMNYYWFQSNGLKVWDKFTISFNDKIILVKSFLDADRHYPGHWQTTLFAFTWCLVIVFQSITFCNYLPVCFLPSLRFFQNIWECGAKKYFTHHQIVNIIQLVIAIKGNFSDLFFFLTSRSKGEFSRH